MKVDRINFTGILVLEYTDPAALGDTPIAYDGRVVPPLPVVNEVTEDDTHTFQFFGTIYVWQLGESGSADDKIVACPNQAVNVILHQ